MRSHSSEVGALYLLLEEEVEEEAEEEHHTEFIDTIESSLEWNGKWDELANLMWMGNAETH